MEIIAYILDLDGVITHTAKLHEAAWKQLFDGYNEKRKRRGDRAYEPYDRDRDYRLYIDGKPRQDGVRSFLEVRGIHLPEGLPDDPPGLETIRGLGNWKNSIFQEALERVGPEVFPDAIEALKRWREQGLRTAVASSSKNCGKILELAGIAELFDVRVDGTHLEKYGIPGKPAPDMFLTAAKLLGAPPEEAAVLEDAVAGVQAARAGNFGLVVGVARFGRPELLLEAGADVIVTKLTDLIPLPELKAA
jgi:beta-phosphoglucomutase family hydrolase